MGAAGVARAKTEVGFTPSFYLILAAIALLVFAFSTLEFMLVEGKSFEDALLEAICTALYVDCGGTRHLLTKVTHVLLGLTTVAVLVVLISGSVDYFVKTRLEGRGMKKKIALMKNHVIVCGYGELGKTVSNVLSGEGKEFIVIDNDPKVIAKLRDAGIPFVEGDALNTKTLEKAGIKRAKRIISALNTDSSNVFLTLTAKELNPGIAVATRAYDEETIGKLHRAGADIIVMPEIIAGLELAHEILGVKEGRKPPLLSKREQ